MPTIVTFTPNTTAKSSEVNSNFSGLNNAIENEHDSAGSHSIIKPTATKQTLVTLTDAATVTADGDVGNLFTVTLGGNRTIAVNNMDAGQAFLIRLVQDGTGSRTVTWFGTIKWPGGSAPTLTTSANEVDSFGFICTSTGNYDGYIVGQDLS